MEQARTLIYTMTRTIALAALLSIALAYLVGMILLNPEPLFRAVGWIGRTIFP